MRTLSAHARAQLVVQNDNINFDTKLHIFNVKGLFKVTRVHPAAAHASECYHILAAKLIMGTSVSTKPARRNLTQLWRNTRSKKSGRKKPQPNDVEPESLGELHASKYSLYKFYLPYG